MQVNPILRLNFTILRTCLSGNELEDYDARYGDAGLVCRDNAKPGILWNLRLF